MVEKIQIWWAGLAPREHILVTMAAALSLVFLLAFGFLAPLMRMHNNTSAELRTVTTEHVMVQQGVQRLQASSARTKGTVSDIDVFRLLVTETAKKNGLSITRLQATQSGGLQIILDAVNPIQLYTWLNELSEQPGGSVLEASIEVRGEGQIQAVVELLAGGA